MTQQLHENRIANSSRMLGRLGNMVTRLARSPDEIMAAQAIRRSVFGSEFHTASKSPEAVTTEADAHDARCDHLLVCAKNASQEDVIIGTQRFFLGRSGDSAQFYSQAEYDIASLRRRHPQAVFMELGRSCILSEWRGKRTMELLWQGTWAYALDNQVDVMIGCASFPGVDIEAIHAPLSFIGRHAMCDDEWHTVATARESVKIADIPREYQDERAALRALPPLIKGYLRLGAMFSDHAVIDREFGSIDVLVVLPVNRINPRYVKYYGEDASKHRAA